MMGRWISTSTKQRIAELANLDIPRSAIAERLGLPIATVSYYVPKTMATKTYRLRSPQGVIYDEVTDIPEFCELHGISTGSLRSVLRGDHKQHKGWSVIK